MNNSQSLVEIILINPTLWRARCQIQRFDWSSDEVQFSPRIKVSCFRIFSRKPSKTRISHLWQRGQASPSELANVVNVANVANIVKHCQGSQQ